MKKVIAFAVLLLLVAVTVRLASSTDAEDSPAAVEQLTTENAKLRAEIQQLRARLRAIEQPDAPAVAEDIAALRFTALFPNGDGSQSIGAFGVGGPIAATLRPAAREVTKMAVDSKGKPLFGRGHHEVYLLQDDREPELIQQSPDLPQISWLSAIAYDAKRSRLLASTFGGGGCLYAFDAATKRWSIVCKPGLGVSALAYAEPEDVLYGVDLAAAPSDAITTLFTFNANGARTSQTRLSQQIPTGGEFGHTQLVWDKGWLFLIQGDPKRRMGQSAAPPRGFLIQPDTGVVRSSRDLRPQ